MARRRIDPVSRPAIGVTKWDQLRNPDPNLHYVYVDPNNKLFGLEYYKSLGYSVEKKRPDGPSPVAGRTISDGDEITALGHVLMSCPKELVEQREAEGQAHVTALEAKMLKQGGVDGLRGFGRGTSVINETSAAYVENNSNV